MSELILQAYDHHLFKIIIMSALVISLALNIKDRKFYVELFSKKKESEQNKQERPESKAKSKDPRVNKTQRINWGSRTNAKGKVIDQTKRNNLQPGNQLKIMEEIERAEHTVDNFEHKFFGTQLAIEGKIIVDSLPKKLHSFEVVDGVCYIDGRMFKVHPDDVAKLARHLNESR